MYPLLQLLSHGSSFKTMKVTFYLFISDDQLFSVLFFFFFGGGKGVGAVGRETREVGELDSSTIMVINSLHVHNNNDNNVHTNKALL